MSNAAALRNDAGGRAGCTLLDVPAGASVRAMPPSQSFAPYASAPENSRGRRYPEADSPTRTCYQRDRDRIIHCGAFRRLQYKTQVFVNHEGDFFRTRLTHSLEVAQVARAVCRNLGLNEDLGEALALAHDLGHPPFGHAGEDALKDRMASFGGFDHNAHSLKVITRLERRYPAFDGLNLTWETLEGVVKHNGPLTGPGVKAKVPGEIASYNTELDLGLGTFASAEAQVAALADDIAYDNHDIEDGLHAKLFTIADLLEVPLIGPVFHGIGKRFPDLDRGLTIHMAVRELIGAMIGDLVESTSGRLKDLNPANADAVRGFNAPVAAFSDRMQAAERGLKVFLRAHMYRHFKVNRMSSKARRVVKDLFDLFLAEPNCLPTERRAAAGEPGSARTAVVVADYIAGMTDRFALDEHRQLFDVHARTQ